MRGETGFEKIKYLCIRLSHTLLSDANYVSQERNLNTTEQPLSPHGMSSGTNGVTKSLKELKKIMNLEHRNYVQCVV